VKGNERGKRPFYEGRKREEELGLEVRNEDIYLSVKV